jgi:hypothetical protein
MKKQTCTCFMKVEPNVRRLMKYYARKDQRYSDFILELIQYKLEHQKNCSVGLPDSNTTGKVIPHEERSIHE